MKKEKQFKITQQKVDVHYEATLWDNREMGGWFPFLFGYGKTQEEADTKLIIQIIKTKSDYLIK